MVLVGGAGGAAAEMRVTAPFFTGDKNIWRDINLEPPSSLPLLPHHPSSFPANRLPGTPTHPALHSTLLSNAHTHARLTALGPMFYSHTLGYTCMRQLSATSCNLHTKKHTRTRVHAMDAVLQQPEMCVAIKCKAVLKAQHPV